VWDGEGISKVADGGKERGRSEDFPKGPSNLCREGKVSDIQRGESVTNP